MKLQAAGKVYLAVRTAEGKPGPFKFVGCADAFSFDMTVDTFEHIERCTGNNGVDYRGIKKKSATLALDITEFNAQNYAFALNGTKVLAEATEGTVTDEVLPLGIEVGDMVIIGGQSPKDGITDLVVTGGGSPPVGALVLDEDYEFDPEYGTIVFLTPLPNGGTLTYKHQNKQFVTMFTAGTQEVWVRYNFLNVANNNAKGHSDFYKARFDPAKGVELINDEIQKLSLTASLLVDSEMVDDERLGQFGRITVAP
jgi:hypothetical protein